MDLIRTPPGSPGSLGVFPGTFNPPTRAHMAIAKAALGVVDQVLFVLPRVFPHKPYAGASFAQRLRMIEAATAGEPRFGIAASERGLFIEIARECREQFGENVELHFLCGRDAAERIIHWDYGEPGAFQKMLNEFGLLVARRRGGMEIPAELRDRIRPLEMGEDWDEVSATEVRERISRGEPWEHLVPGEIAGLVGEFYQATGDGKAGRR
ncbi:MAG: nicotinate-nicotinamide nucleotide adenylyltransferase [Bryobacteraceae bacterium]